jgi:hypothetical protein
LRSHIVVLGLLAATLFLDSPARADSPSKPVTDPTASPGLYVKILLSKEMKASKLKPGDTVAGTLARDVYSADRKMFSAGDHVVLTVDHLERRRRTPNDHWPWVVKAFSPRHENFPVFTKAAITESSAEVELPVSMISVGRMREVYAAAKTQSPDHSTQGNQGTKKNGSSHGPVVPTVILEAFPSNEPPSSPSNPFTDAQKLALLPPGTRCKIALLDTVSASKSKPGDRVRARLLEPVILDSQIVLAAGSLFEGKVIKKVAPRTLSRSGSLYLGFTEVTLPQGNRYPISASLAGVEVNQRSHTRIDREGVLHGERPGTAWMAINIGVTAGISKEVDDGVQLLIEALVSTATDASTAGTSRIIASCVSGIFMATRHGRDVVLPRFSEMELSIDRPVSVAATPIAASTGQ